MEEVHRLHKDVAFGWAAGLRDFLAARAEARRRRNMAVWEGGSAVSLPAELPNDMYRLMRGAFGRGLGQ